LKVFSVYKSERCNIFEKFSKKVLAGKEKGCTFAPAKREGETMVMESSLAKVL